MLCKDDVDEKLELVSALDNLKNDIDSEVSEIAFDTDMRSNVRYKENESEYKAKLEREE